MTKEELQKIINQFDEEELKKQGIFSILQYGGGSDESFIKANKEGLEMFALELLKSSRDAESVIADKEKNIIPLNYDESWIDEFGDTFIQYIEPIKGKQELKSKKYEQTFFDKLIPAGCIITIIVIVIATIVGLVTITNWLF